MPFPMRCYLSILAVVAIAVIAILPLSRTNLLLVLAMCALVVVAERLSRVKVAVGGSSMSVSLVVTIITVLILTPPAAALVGLVTSLAAQRPTEWTWSKQIVTSSMSSLIPASGAAVCYLAGGHSGHFLDFPWFLWSFAAAVTTCLVVNGLLFAEYVALSGNGRFLDVLRGTQQRSAMPYYSSGVLALIFLSLWNDIGWYTAPLVVVPMYIAHWSLSQYSREEAAHEGTIAALVQAVEIKDSYTRGHSERVARGAEMLARQLRMPQERVAMLRFAGLLHDIGKLGVPTRLLTSTGGLTEEEYKLLCMHPNHGVAVLRDIRFLTEVYDGVLYHHERLDGRGYPTGKSGDAIPEFARIIGVADAFDAMTSTRSYRAARSIEDAVAELRRGAGTQFDPVLVQAFEDALALAERAGRPWLPSELPASPATADAVATETGPWPLPKRVPGFSFADHDDPFVPAEWFSNWYPNWLADAWDGEGEGPSGPYDWPYDGIYDVRPLAGPDGRIPGPRTGELVPAPRVGALEPGPDARALPGTAERNDDLDSAEPAEPADSAEADEAGESGDTASEMSPESLADLDDGWSARMHSAVIREQEEAGSPEPEAEQEHDDTAEPPRLFLRLRDISRGAAASTGADPGWFSRGAVAESVQRPDDAGDLRGSHDPVEHDDLGEPLESRKASGDSDEADDSEDSQDSASDTPRGSEGSAA